jgi:guanylate kinase
VSAAHPTPGSLFVVSAPSGAGKTSLVRTLIESDTGVVASVSHTTRDPRPGEREGDHYHFVDPATFERMADQGAFLEHARVFGRAYGTSRAAVQARLERGLDVILEIDWQGARQVREQMSDSVGVFILPPSLAQLRTRLEARGQDDARVIASRMSAAVREIAHHAEFDYLVVNDRFESALDELAAIVTARRLACAVQCRRHAALIGELLAGTPSD